MEWRLETNERTAGMPMPAALSLLWVFIMFNMVFAGILSFMYPGFLKEVMTGHAVESTSLADGLRR